MGEKPLQNTKFSTPFGLISKNISVALKFAKLGQGPEQSLVELIADEQWKLNLALKMF